MTVFYYERKKKFKNYRTYYEKVRFNANLTTTTVIISTSDTNNDSPIFPVEKKFFENSKTALKVMKKHEHNQIGCDYRQVHDR